MRRPLSAKSTRAGDADLVRCTCLHISIGGFEVCFGDGVTGTTGARSFLKSFATGPSSNISARDKTRQLDNPHVAAKAKLPLSLRLWEQ
jgi:hypothetical protein